MKLWIAMASLVCVLCGSTANGQEIRATISGTVTDGSGAVVPGVSVVAVHLQRNQQFRTSSSSEGLYRISNLPPGEYEVRAEAEGFKIEVRKGISLALGQSALVDLRLELGQRQELIEVTDAPPLVEASSSALSGLVGEKQMRDLPLNGRDFFQLALLQPGVVPTLNAGPNPWAQGGITKAAVNGLRPTYNNMTMDGTDVNDPTYNIPPGGAAGAFLGVEAIREFRILTNTMSAEYGRNAGAAISVVTHSGTNTLHGSAFEFHRNSALDAKNYFDLPDEPIPHFVRNQFGATIGGPIRKDRTFFFGSYEGLRESLGRTGTATVPNELAHQGFLPDPLNPGSLLNVGVAPQVAPFLELYPLPNGQDFGDGTGLLTTAETQPTREHYFSVRIDHEFSASDLLFARYTFDDSDTQNPYVSTTVPGFPSFQFRRNQFFTLSETHTFSPTLFNEFRFGFNRTFYGAREKNTFPGLSISALPGDRPLGLIDLFGLSAIGNSILFPINSAGNTFQFLNHVSVSKTRHFLKFGADARRVQMNGIFDLFSSGNYIFFTLRDFLEANPFAFLGALSGSDSNRGFRQTQIAFFVQDDWKATARLTLNLGLRYEHNTSPTESQNRLVNIRDLLNDAEVTVGEPLYKAPKRMFAPRIGFAWTPWEDGKTVVRGGYGIFFDQIWMNLYGNTRWSEPFYHTTFFLSPQFPDALAGAGAAIPIGINNPFQFEPSQPYAMQFNLNIQRQLPWEIVAMIAYVGSRGVHLPAQRQANVPQPTVLPDGSLFFPAGAPRRNPNLGPVSIIETISHSSYHSLQTKIEKQMSQGLHFQLAYTFSKSMDDASGPYPTDFTTDPAVPQNSFDLSDNRAVSSFDHTHTLVGNLSYDLPFGRGRKFGADIGGMADAVAGGWSISSIVTGSSGNPFTVLLGFDRCQTIDPPCRPNVVPSRLRLTGDPNQWFDPAGFELQPEGFLGNAPRNVLRAPGLFVWDFALRKTFNVTERTKLEFRTEIFNVPNHPNFAAPNNTRDPTGAGGRGDVVIGDASGVPVGNAGKIFSTVTTSRQIQFGLKLLF